MSVSEDQFQKLYWSAVCVANAIHAGVGGMIKGTLMEQEFRDALRLLPGELRDVPKSNYDEAGAE